MKSFNAPIVLITAAALILPAFAADSIQGKKRVLEFPTDKKVARIFYCRADNKHPNETVIVTAASRPAIGSVTLQPNDKIALEVTWDGAEDLSWLSKLKPDDVLVLDLHKLPVQKKGYAYIAKQTGLKYLFLEDTELEDDDLESIGKLTNLVALRISKTAVRGSGFRFLYPLKKLEKLNLGHLDLDEKSVSSLQCLHSLKELDVANCGLTNSAIKAISGITSLTLLSLRSNKHLDESKLSQLRSLKNLSNLNLADTNVSSNVGKELKSLPHLAILRLGGGKTASLDMTAIQKQLPACRVISVDSKDEFAKRIFSPLH